MFALAMRSIRQRPGRFAATLLSAFLGAAIIMTFNSMHDTAGAHGRRLRPAPRPLHRGGCRRRLRHPPGVLRRRLHPDGERPPTLSRDRAVALLRRDPRADQADGRGGGGGRRPGGRAARDRSRDARRAAAARPLPGQRAGRRVRRLLLRPLRPPIGPRHHAVLAAAGAAFLAVRRATRKTAPRAGDGRSSRAALVAAVVSVLHLRLLLDRRGADGTGGVRRDPARGRLRAAVAEAAEGPCSTGSN
jgi:hypothetical protein